MCTTQLILHSTNRGDYSCGLSSSDFSFGTTPEPPRCLLVFSSATQEAWSVKDQWALVGEGLDFVDEDEAKAQTPLVNVVLRPAGGSGMGDEDEDFPVLANTVFVAPARRRRGSSASSASSSHYLRRNSGH